MTQDGAAAARAGPERGECPLAAEQPAAEHAAATAPIASSLLSRGTSEVITLAFNLLGPVGLFGGSR
jgi:hypothetical protein